MAKNDTTTTTTDAGAAAGPQPSPEASGGTGIASDPAFLAQLDPDAQGLLGAGAAEGEDTGPSDEAQVNDVYRAISDADTDDEDVDQNDNEHTTDQQDDQEEDDSTVGEEDGTDDGAGPDDPQDDNQDDDEEEDDGGGDDAEADDETDDEEAEEQPEVPKGVRKLQKRVNRLTAQKAELAGRVEELEEQLEAAAAQAPAYTVTGGGENPLSGLRTEAEVKQTLAQARATRDWCRQNRDGGEAPDGKGGTVEYDADQVARMLDYADDVIAEHAPERLDYIRRHQASARHARQHYPELYVPDSADSRAATAIMEKWPALATIPEHVLLVGDLVRGMRARLDETDKGKAPASKKRPATAATSRPGGAPAKPSAKAKAPARPAPRQPGAAATPSARPSGKKADADRAMAAFAQNPDDQNALVAVLEAKGIG